MVGRRDDSVETALFTPEYKSFFAGFASSASHANSVTSGRETAFLAFIEVALLT